MSGKCILVYLYNILIESLDKYKYTQIEIVYINIKKNKSHNKTYNHMYIYGIYRVLFIRIGHLLTPPPEMGV